MLKLLVWLKALGNLLSVCFPHHKNTPTDRPSKQPSPKQSSSLRSAHGRLASGQSCCAEPTPLLKQGSLPPSRSPDTHLCQAGDKA